MSLKYQVTLCETCIRAILSYASEAFAHVTLSNLQHLQVIQNKFMRMTTGYPRYVRNVNLHRDIKLLTIMRHFKEFSQYYFDMIAADYEHDESAVPRLGRTRLEIFYPSHHDNVNDTITLTT